jgi:two-component system phosphate regulon sensor histidine kinase PhoR
MDSAKRKSRNLLLSIVALIVVPLTVYLIYSATNMKENERTIQEIYVEQLQSVLFSINQYSNDFMNAYINRLEKELNSNGGTLSREVKNLTDHYGFKIMLILPLDDDRPILYEQQTIDDQRLKNELSDIRNTEKTRIKQLKTYMQQGYQKLEPARMIVTENGAYQLLLVILSVNESEYLFVGAIEPLSFVQEVLRPKMQEIVDEQMIIALTEKESDEVLFSTDTLRDKKVVTEDMWLFPSYHLGVVPKGATLQDIVNERVRYNLISMGLLAALLISGIIILVRNVRREIVLAQNKSDFVSSVSHELRTPLSLINMFSETLLLGRVKDEKKEKDYLEIIHKETNRLTTIVNRILNFSQIEAGKRTYFKETVELNELVREICSDYSFHLEQKGFESSCTTAESEIMLQADRDAIYEAVVNLIDNAIKYSTDDKRVEVSTGSTHEQAWIAVEDHGDGIAESKIQYIFDKFYRVSERDQYKIQGAGLGLTIVMHIMQAHNGTIDVKTQIGKGSIFKLIFNLASENG